MVESVVFGLLAAWLVWSHDQERRQWAKERSALLERCVPGLTLTEPSEPTPTPRYGSDEWEYEIEQARRTEVN